MAAPAPEVAHYMGPGGVVWKMALPLSKIMAKQERKGIIRRVDAAGKPYKAPEPEQPTTGDSDDTPPPEQPPAESALKPDWVGYAVRVGGLSVDDAEAMTKADLVDRFGRKPGGTGE